MKIVLIILMLLTTSCYTYNEIQVTKGPKPFYYREYHYGHYYPYPPNAGRVIPSTPLPRQKKERYHKK